MKSNSELKEDPVSALIGVEPLTWAPLVGTNSCTSARVAVLLLSQPTVCLTANPRAMRSLPLSRWKSTPRKKSQFFQELHHPMWRRMEISLLPDVASSGWWRKGILVRRKLRRKILIPPPFMISQRRDVTQKCLTDTECPQRPAHVLLFAQATASPNSWSWSGTIWTPNCSTFSSKENMYFFLLMHRSIFLSVPYLWISALSHLFQLSAFRSFDES